jgi:cytidylate kinase
LLTSMINLRNKIIIAIDGYSSCGKSSFARRIAKELNYLYLDSGAMYRTVALNAQRSGWINGKKIDFINLIDSLKDIKISFRNLEGENQAFLNDQNVEKEIRGVEVSAFVSEISKIPEVRKHLVLLQQELGKDKGIVMDGRDIGTVVFPKAEIKLFMTADPAVRAKRRYDELKTKGISASLEEITQNINERDFQDINRGISPLTKAIDAILLDNSYMNFEDQMKWFIKLLYNKDLVKEK